MQGHSSLSLRPRQLLLGDSAQELHELFLIIIDLTPLFRHEAGVQTEGLRERDGDEAIVRQHGGRGEERGADLRLDEVLDRMEVGRVVDDLRLAAERRVGDVHEALDE